MEIEDDERALTMPLSPRTEKILKRTSIGISILVGTVDLLILAFLAWSFYFVFFNEDTLYSPHFSEEAFDRVHVGMPEAEVRGLLGLPLKIIIEDSNGRNLRMIDFRDERTTTSYPDVPSGSPAETAAIIYFYSQQGNSYADWHVRTVTFTPRQVVSEAYKSYHVD
jgi:hypothetical protein